MTNAQRPGVVTKPPTSRQLLVLWMIHVRRGLGETVSVRTLAADLGFASSTSSRDHLQALRWRGLVDWDPTSASTIHLTERGKALVGTVRCERVTDKKMLRALKRLPNWAPGVVDKVLSGKRRRT